VIGAASAALIIDLFALPWYGIDVGAPRRVYTYPARPSLTANGWDSLTAVRYLILLTAFVGLAIWWLQATRAAPALPVVVTILAAIPSGLELLAVVWRVLIDLPGSGLGARAGAYVGLALSVVLAAGIYRSLRVDAPVPGRDAAGAVGVS
jgi:hypothetical protein